ncbi:hypothetical protein [Halococcoides cellulosivorans]|uniref:Dockerin domain-containing protein n=1 Tax=Halococcoides cellulosivorans TaxID=1679096 RepID=A0A2R4X1R2_9EURY|nr:hypothetical protein [Halococcoides cellulosivorans]AWB27744.1 hypothetical protein HARCEL1_08485 [Halococcoides cellulosivorans]
MVEEPDNDDRVFDSIDSGFDSIDRRSVLYALGATGGAGVFGSGLATAASDDSTTTPTPDFEVVETSLDVGTEGLIGSHYRNEVSITVDGTTVHLEGRIVYDRTDEPTLDVTVIGGTLLVTVGSTPGDEDETVIMTRYTAEIELTGEPETVYVEHDPAAPEVSYANSWHADSVIVSDSIETVDRSETDLVGSTGVTVEDTRVRIDGRLLATAADDPTLATAYHDGDLAVTIGIDGGMTAESQIDESIRYVATIDLSEAPDSVDVAHDRSLVDPKQSRVRVHWPGPGIVDHSIERTGVDASNPTDRAAITVSGTDVTIRGEIVSDGKNDRPKATAQFSDGTLSVDVATADGVAVSDDLDGDRDAWGIEYRQEIALDSMPEQVYVDHANTAGLRSWRSAGVEDTTIEKTGETMPGPNQVEDDATITCNGSTVEITGQIVAPGGECFEPSIEAATNADGSRAFVQIGTVAPVGAVCVENPSEVEYAASVELAEPPQTVAVVHGDRSSTDGTRGWRFLERWWVDPIETVTTTWFDERGCTPDTPPASASITVTDATVRIDGTTSYARQYPPLADVAVDDGRVDVGFAPKEPGAKNLHTDCIYAADYAIEIELADALSTLKLAYSSPNGSVEKRWPSTDLDPVDGTVPGDIDGDGLHEDFSGDGELNFPDVNAFFQHTETAAVQDHPDAYDFTGDGTVDSQDVLALFEMV